MLKISKLADYATVLMCALARAPSHLATTADLSEVTQVPQPTASKLLKTLLKAGLLVSARGVSGGYRLSEQPQAISVAAIIQAVDGDIALTACSHGHQGCQLSARCSVQHSWQTINDATIQLLGSVTVEHLLQPNLVIDINVRSVTKEIP